MRNAAEINRVLTSTAQLNNAPAYRPLSALKTQAIYIVERHASFAVYSRLRRRIFMQKKLGLREVRISGRVIYCNGVSATSFKDFIKFRVLNAYSCR